MSPPRNTGPDGDSAQTPQQMARRERRVHPLPQASEGGQRSRPEHKANQRTRNFAAARKLRRPRIENRGSRIERPHSLRPSTLNPPFSTFDPRSSGLADVFPLAPV